VDVYTGEFAPRALAWGGRLWQKAFKNDDWISMMYMVDYKHDWQRAPGKALIIATRDSWVEQSGRVQKAPAGSVVCFSRMRYFRFHLARGFVMWGK
jgi:hypothetical protein